MSINNHIPDKVSTSGLLMQQAVRRTYGGDACNFGTTPSQRSLVRLQIGEDWYYISPAPMLSLSSREIFSGTNQLGYEYNINLTGYMFGSACASGETSEQQRNDAYIDGIQFVIDSVDDIRQLQLYSNAQAQPVGSWAIESATASLEETTMYDAARYTISLVGFYKSGATFSKIASFSDTWSMEPNYDIGAAIFRSNNQAAGTVYNFRRSVTASARPGRHIGKSGDSEQERETALDKVEDYVNTVVYNSGYFPNNMTFANLVRTENRNYGDDSFTVDINGYIISGSFVNSNGYFNKVNYSSNWDTATGTRSVDINGKIIGFVGGSYGNAYYNESECAKQALYGFNRFTNEKNANDPTSAPIFEFALDVGGNLNYSPLSITVGENGRAGEIDYSYKYDNRTYNIFSNSIAENITVVDTYPKDSYNLVQVPGRTYDLIQYMNSASSYERDVTIEIIISKDSLPGGDVSAFKNNMMNGPSIYINAGALNDILNKLQPNSDIRLIKNSQESWSPKEGKYTLTIGWIYQ